MKSVSDLYAEFEQEGDAAPSTPTVAGLYAEFEAEESEKDQRVWNLIGSNMPQASLGEGVDRDTAIARLSQDTGIEPAIVRERFDELQRKWQQSQFDPRALRQSAPWIDLLLDHRPDLAPVVAKDLSEGNLLTDVGRLGASGAVGMGFGSVARGLGTFAAGAAEADLRSDARRNPALREIVGSDPSVPNPLAEGADELNQIAQQIRSGVRQSTLDEIESSQPGGDLFSPSTWTLGEDPSLLGYFAQTVEVFGGMAPIIGTSLLVPGAGGTVAGAVVGGLQGGGGAAEEAREMVERMASTPSSSEPGAPPLIAVESEAYQRLRAQGLSHEEAAEAVAVQAERIAAGLAGIVAGAGGAATARIVAPASKLLSSRSTPSLIAGRTGIAMLEEGTQETLESVASGLGVELGAGIDVDLTEGTFGDFALGAIAGGPTGAVGGVGAAAQRRVQRRIETAQQILEAAKKSQLAKASPETFAQVVEAETARTGEAVDTLYLDAEPTLRVFQDAGVSPVEIFGEEIAEQISEASVTGGKIAVPVAKLEGLVNTGMEARLAEHVTTRPDEDTAAQAKIAAEELEARAQALANEMEAVAPGPAESRLLTLLEQDAEQAFKKGERKPNLALWRAFVRTQAELAGADPDVLFGAIEVRVRRKMADGVAPQQAVEESTPAVDVAESTPEGVITETPEIGPNPAETQGMGAIAEIDPTTSKGTLVTPQRREPVTYRLVEADDLIQSHDPHTFQPNADYPPGVQEREYHRQPEEQVKVASGAQGIDPSLLLTDAPTANDGPPIVTSGDRAIVVGGNGRTMMLKRASEEQRAAYRQALKDRAARFGVDPSQVDSMQSPVLVRVLDEVADTAPVEDLIGAVRRTNEALTQALSPRARAVAESRQMTPETVDALAVLLEGEQSLRDVMRTKPQAVIEALRKAGIITSQNRSEWVDDRGLTDGARDRVEGMFLGRVVGTGDRMAQTQRAVLNKLERIAPHLLRIEGRNPDFSETANVQAALDLLNDARIRGLELEQLLGQQDLFGRQEHDPHVVRLAQLIRDTGPVNLAARFRAWARLADFNPRQASMFSSNPTLDEARKALVGEVAVGLLQQGPVVLYQRAMPPPLPRLPERLAAHEERIRNLPVEHAVALDSRGLVIVEAQGDENRVTLTAQQQAAVRASGSAVITHNHPDNEMLSASDVVLAILTDAAEIRATNPNGNVWRVRRPEGGWPIPEGAPEPGTRDYSLWIEEHVGTPIRAAQQRGIDAANERWAQILEEDPSKENDRGLYLEVVNEEVARAHNEAGAGWTVEVLARGRVVLDGERAAEGAAEAEAGVGRLFQDEATPRGFMERRGDELAITLTEKADKSTFLHETGHAFLEIALDLAERPEATEATKKQAEAILGWLGISSRADLTVEHHETWARAFEAYLMEGNAPSRELESAFRKFRNWLTRIYRTIKGLNVEIDDEVRSIFDRLLAVDEELSREAANLGPKLFNSPEEAGMTLDEYQRYLDDYARIHSHAQKRGDLAAMKDHLRTLDKAWKDEQRDLYRQALEDYEDLPERRTWSFLRGRIAGDVRLDYKQVVKVLGAERARRYLTAKIGGSSIDDVAQQLGYTSGADMLRKVDALPSKEEWAKAEAERRIREKHPSMLEQRDRLRAEIAKGLHGDHTMEWHLREHKALMRRAGIDGEPPPLAVIRRAAEIVAERRQVKNLAPHVAQRSAAKFGRQAYLAAVKGDHGKAAALKRQQIVNEALYRHLRDMKDEVARAEDYLARQAKDSIRQKVGKASDGNPQRDFLPGFDALLGAVQIGPEVDPETALDVFEQMVRLMEEAQTPLEDVARLRGLISNPRPWRELTVQETRAVRDTIRQVRAVTDQMNEIRIANEKVATEELIARMEEEAAARRPDLGPAYVARQQKPLHRRVADTFIGLHGSLVDPQALLESLGETASSLWDRFVEAKVNRSDLAERFLEPVYEMWRKMPADTMRRRFEVLTDFHEVLGFPEGVNLGGPVDRLTLIMIALNMGNQSNRDRLLGGYGWDQQVVLDYLNKHLTEAEWQWIQSVWDLLESMWPEISAKERRVRGVEPEKIQATAIETPYGILRGGYFPAKYDSRSGVERKYEGVTEEAVSGYFGRNYQRAGTAKSHTKRRADHYDNVINLDWAIVPAHVSQVIHDVAFDEFIRDMGRLLEHERMETLLFRRLGERRANDLKQWIRFVANEQAETVSQFQNDWSRLGLWGRGRLAVSALGWSATVMLQDFTNAFVAMARSVNANGVSFREGSIAYVQGLGGLFSRGGAYRLATEKSGYMRARFRGESDARRRRFILNVGRNRLKVSRAIEAVANTAFFFLEQTDKMASTQIWLGRYRYEIKQGTSETEAVRLADRAVSSNLPTMDKMEQGDLLRKPGFVGAMISFYGYFAKLYNITVPGLGGDALQSVMEAKRAGTAKAAAQASVEVAKMAGRYAAIMFVVGPLAEFLGGRGPEDDEEIEDFLLRKIAATPFMKIPLVGPVASGAVESAIAGEPMWEGSARAPLQSVAMDMVKNIGKLADEDADTDKRVWAALDIALTGAGLPARQPSRTLRYLHAVLTGDEDPETIFDVAGGVAFGPERQGNPETPFTVANDLLRD